MKVIFFSTILFLLLSCGGGGGDDVSAPQPEPNRDNTPPVITIVGEALVIHELGTDYIEQGANASDDTDGQITVEISGMVDADNLGTYQITYTATDSAGNRSVAGRSVTVVGSSMVDFYTSTANRASLPESYSKGLEALIYGQDALINDDFQTAKEIVEDIFAQQPLSQNSWTNGYDLFGLNVGYPVAYYGLRMLEDITTQGDIVTMQELRLTAVMSLCATVERLTLPDFEVEVVGVNIDQRLLQNDYQILFEATDLFRRWVKAITLGSELTLEVYESDDCSYVSTADDGDLVFSYPDIYQVIGSVPDTIRNQTDMWMVVVPSAVPGDGSGFNKEFITGGMGLIGEKPVFISDDAWFIRKPEHLGFGQYSVVERRAYHPQWFQHEFMHHLYRTWPEFGLEVESHQWFDRNSWPDDFEGRYEADYYAESIEKRLVNAQPTLAEGLKKSISGQ
ncbi:DUF5011 domain-containing protein [Aestuariibacter salexigens]|uniref:DUF5011 domain-containing protein n=1 Tax=Aestuariibacter salexigens TaxID=226010 RepID=UPI000478EBB7|nr:DUF5011 domain-containing protein [Aestuariibacter salexigens]